MVKKVYFIGDRRSGAYFMRGQQVAEGLRHFGVDATACEWRDDIKDAIVVFVKQCPAFFVEKAKKNGNRVIFDVVDKFCRPDDMAESLSFRMFDDVIFCTIAAREFFKPLFNATLHTIYHHWDPRLSKEMTRFGAYPREVRTGYIGASFNHLYKDELPDVVPIYNPNQWHELSPLFTLHYSVKQAGNADFFFKPTTKVSTAAAVLANIIVTKDPGTLELLPEAYPYYVDPNGMTPKTVHDALQKAYDTFNDVVWFQGLEMMLEVKDRTAIQTTIDYWLMEILKIPASEVETMKKAKEVKP